MVHIAEPMEREPEVVGVQGHVKKMISLFSDEAKSGRQTRNGSDTSYSTPKTSGNVDSSKRTSHSHESSPTTNGSIPLRKVSTGGSMGSSGAENSPKSPSYLKLSCAISGYSSYNSYNGSPRLNSKLSDTNISLVQTTLQDSAIPQGNHVENGGTPQGLSREPSVHSQEPSVVSMDSNSREPSKEPSVGSIEPLVNSGEPSVSQQCAQSCGSLVDNVIRRSHSEDRVSVNGVARVVSQSVDNVDVCGVDDVDSCIVVSKRSEILDSGLSTPERTLDQSTDNISTPHKDGPYYLAAMDRQEKRFSVLCLAAMNDLESGKVPEEVSGKIRAAIGKANLLTSKKFQQFRGLCRKNMEQDESDPFQTTCQDLAGFWDMVLLQVVEIGAMFDDIDRLRRAQWKGLTLSNARLNAVNQTPSKSMAVRPKAAKVKALSGLSSSTPKTVRSSEAAKQREQARRRLLEAKRAGRQRKSSHNDEVEIFVPQ